MKRNSRKFAILNLLSRQDSSIPANEIAWAIRLPYRSSGLYRLLLNYAHWGLILRHRGPDGRYRYRIGERGRARLAWLRRR